MVDVAVDVTVQQWFSADTVFLLSVPIINCFVLTLIFNSSSLCDGNLH